MKFGKGFATGLSKTVSKTKTSGTSIGGRIMKHPGRSAAIGLGGMGAYGMLRGRRGSGTGKRVPGAQRGMRNY